MLIRKDCYEICMDHFHQKSVWYVYIISQVALRNCMLSPLKWRDVWWRNFVCVLYMGWILCRYGSSLRYIFIKYNTICTLLKVSKIQNFLHAIFLTLCCFLTLSECYHFYRTACLWSQANNVLSRLSANSLRQSIHSS